LKISIYSALGKPELIQTVDYNTLRRERIKNLEAHHLHVTSVEREGKKNNFRRRRLLR